MKQAHYHERLDCYHFALEAARFIRNAPWPAGDRDLRLQARRAADSVVLNIAEGCASSLGARRNHYSIAAGSAAEATATLNLAALPGGPALQQKLRSVAAMLRGLR
jgi:four helix bundle protein